MEPTAKVVIVEDDEKIAALLHDYCLAAGYATERFGDGKSALAHLRQQAAENAPDIVLLDLMLPQLDGLEVCKAVRQFSQVPIIMLTARVDEIDRLLGLELGADDYVCKPFSPREVMARVKAQLRRANASKALPPGAPAPHISVERDTMRVLCGGVSLGLTPVEFRLLAELIAHPERVYARAQLLDFLHQDQRDVSDRTVDSHIKNIRKKLEARLPGIDCLQSVYGVGYRFSPPQ